MTRRRDHLLITLALCALPGSAIADSLSGIDAAFDACIDPVPSLTARIEALAASGWVTQDDTVAGRDRYALYGMMRLGLDSSPGDPKRLEQFNTIRSRPLQPLPEPGGQAPNPATVIGSLEKTGRSGFQYELPDQSANLMAQLFLQGDEGGSATIQCALMLGPTLAPEMIAARVPPDGGSVTQDESQGGAPKLTSRAIRVEGPADGFRLHLDHYDLGSSAAIAALLADAQTGTPFSSLLSTTLSPVPLR